ncbi:glycosyltransferase [Citrobacter portucalensis]|uniref:glycosyltransferase n=1 Tax=Citrobacter portucalensis TaxID=1639133 RepID=UPI0023AEDD42|nr:glycosyltransferase [Citrobacter portucalensis]
MKILINASNLHVGGGVQVAASFITELFNDSVRDVSIVCSSSVFDNLASNVNTESFESFDVVDVYGTKKISSHNKLKFSGFDVCFTVFGPFYSSLDVKKHICGFAQPWIAYPNNVVYKKLPLIEYIFNKVKFKIQSIYFKKYDHLIVEQKHVKDALVNHGYTEETISIVENCVSSIYDIPSDWLSIDGMIELDSNRPKLGFIGRPYIHKNIEILKFVNEILLSKYGFHCDFFFTFSEVEMKNLGFIDIENFHSVGSISTNQCPFFYQSIDALVFPSLLECFSATPIEAMKMNTTVIASDLPFVREICREASFYFDPLDAESIADSIIYAFSRDDLREEKIKMGNHFINVMPKASDRAKSYLDIIKKLN